MNFFIERPIFAMVIALIMILAGGICIKLLPVAQYPELVPPEIQVTTQYIGAGSQVVANSVTTPLEEQLNGAESMIYMASDSTNNGNSIITMTFSVGYSQDFAQVEALNRTNTAMPEMPEEVSKYGVTITKLSTNIVLVVNLISPKGTYDQRFLGNYADIHITDPLARIPGVAQIQNFGLQKYAMRVWLDPARLTSMGLTAMDVVDAVENQNKQVAAGSLGQPPAPEGQAFQFKLNTLGRLSEVSQFEDIILRANPDGSVVRIKDVGRVELGAEDYSSSANLSGKATAAVGVFQLPNANSIQLYNATKKTMDNLAKYFPEDMEYTIAYNTTTFVKASMREIVVTLLVAILLVFLVVYIFLQSVRTTLIPILTVPVSLIGTFAIMMVMGFSINTLSLLGLVLAVGLVVDDAIVVVENVQRQLQEGEKDLRKAARKALAEVRGPIIATTISLMAVFVPVAFLPGMTGMLYNQFALTIAFAVMLSGINSMTLSPALAAKLLRPESGKKNAFFRAFNRLFEKTAGAYEKSVKKMARVWYLVFIAFGVLCAITVFLFTMLPTGFVPEEDQGYFIVTVQLPDAATTARTEAVMEKVNKILLETPGVAETIVVSGYDIIDGLAEPYAGFGFPVLTPWGERKSPELQLKAIMDKVQARFNAIQEAEVICSNAPSIPGLGATGGFQFEIQDKEARGIESLSDISDEFLKRAGERPELAQLFTTFSLGVPQRYIDINRTKAETRKVSINDINETLQINLGSIYVNEFNKYGRVYKVYVQADKDARSDERDVTRLKVRNRDGEMIELSAFVTIRPMTGPYNVEHYNEYASIQINGNPAKGYSSGQAITAMDEVANEVLVPHGYGYEWTGITYQQLEAGNMAPVVFCLSLIFVFLVLAAQYESWAMPVMVLMAVPLGLLGSVGALLLRGMDLDVYGQIGLVMLIGLSAKNAILIVEFAKDRRDKGAGILEAAMEAARIRLRPILMTAFAFILGVFPLAIATGAGANARRSLGTTVVAGMAASTVLIIMVPIFYYVIEKFRERRVKGAGGNSATGDK